MLLWNSLAFPLIQRMLAIWPPFPLPFLKPAWTSGSSQFTYCWSLPWRILIITLLVCEMSAIVWSFEHFWHCLSLGLEWKTIFQSCEHCWVFQICWHIELTASSFRIWNSSAGNLSPPLALLVVMHPKAYLNSHTRMSGSRWVTRPTWLSWSLRPFLYSFFLCFLAISY